MKKAIIFILVLALIGGGAFWFLRGKQAQVAQVAYKTSEVTKGQVSSTIRATGTIEPEDLIDVGAQITGQIMEFGTDVDGNEVDYCSVVKKGQLLARIDDVTYKANVTIAKANLGTAQAQLTSAKAEVAQMTALLNQASRDWNRAQKLGVGDALSQKEWDAYQSAYESAVANLEAANASVESANASIAEAQANLEIAERNLSYCEINATVDGVVIDRRVNIGQTVTASMETPSLFLVAKDLRQVEIWVPVNEADIGSIKEGQRVTFTVDAFADKTFEGKVGRVRLNASMTSNVVTYTVEVVTSNDDSTLLPYLTANVSFILEESPADSLLVPAAALRWTPEGWEAPAELQGKDVIFVQDAQGKPVPVAVKKGVTDEINVAIETDQLVAGDHVITGTLTAIEVAQASAAGSNPFLPKPPSRDKRDKGPPGP